MELEDIQVGAVKAATPLDAFEASLAHEQKVSEQIREIVRTADEVGDLDSRQLLNWFLDEQVEEEATVSGVIEQLKLAGDNGSGLLLVDASLAER